MLAIKHVTRHNGEKETQLTQASNLEGCADFIRGHVGIHGETVSLERWRELAKLDPATPCLEIRCEWANSDSDVLKGLNRFKY